ncbi:MAG: Mov34/MPN/PAD-1 family protein [Spirochaetes bacterium]|nr:Mov34/MPN/PAD-1 family protein [Spirochaetota bacterium]
MQVIFSNRAYTAVISETSEKIKTETGGIFLGCFENGNWYVIEAIDPGPKAIFQVAYFEYDKKYTEHLINKLVQIYQAKLTLIGLWHRHPGSFDEFSSTDDGTNSDYAKMSANGAVSVLVNIDPKFRITPYHVAWPLKYTKIAYKVGDNLIPEHLLALRNAEKSLGYINSYADKLYSGNKTFDKPEIDFLRLLVSIKGKLQKTTLSKDDYKPEEAEKYRDFLIDSLLDDITYFSENRKLALKIEQNKGVLSLSHKGSSNIVTMIHFIYVAHKKQIVFSHDDDCYLYTPGLFTNLLTDFNPADVTFKSGLLRAFGIGNENKDL